MRGSEIAKRYAKALFKVAQEDEAVEKIHGELAGFALTLRENKNLMEFFANPVFDQNDKISVMKEILKKMKISGLTANFLYLLVEKRRMNIFFEVEACFRDYLDTLMNKVRVQVKTAFPLSDEMVARLSARLQEITGKNVEMAVDDDRSLLGGIVVAVGDTLYDGSIKTQLSRIRELIREEI
ncbi:MAG: ATP synthase F1 subunit delta [Syntrophales bacterium]|nr:ATP synthase F1 subunit delta [Syntrophales bacterium]MCK9528130.1 ATP synthase F1 subunit delta [Syntrophales bacterium]MDX9921099.1 ATP synthase F1 subunit delta [Syntrophales bacterium]